MLYGRDQLIPPTPSTAAFEWTQVDWSRVTRGVFLIEQTLRYDYPVPITDLRHRLMIVPPEHFGDQRRLDHRLLVSLDSEIQTSEDEFGNMVIDLQLDRVESTIEFDCMTSVERLAVTPHLVDGHWLSDPRLLSPSALTQPSPALVRAATSLTATAALDLTLVEAINQWVHQAMGYEAGVTGVSTNAAVALDLARGVCQDFAHVMLAMCRIAGLPCRYVSGHLLGEGSSHAWVEVLLPAATSSGSAEVFAFDPTHGCRAGLNHITIAVGRDYADVPPTSGVFESDCGGVLTTRKRVTVTDLA